MPIYEIWMQATRSHTAATFFMILLFIAATVALIAVQQTASRLTWSLGRDNAFLGSKFLGRVHSSVQVPVWALVLNNFIVFIIGFIYLGSSTAFNAFIGTGLILQQVTYAIPAVLVMYRRRSSEYLPSNRPFKLRGLLGWIVNIATVVFAIVVVIFYDLPVVLPVTGSNMSEFPCCWINFEG
jgi:choline transport protein